MNIERPDGRRSRLIVFSDLDHTLLDGRDYSHAKAAPGLALLEAQDVPLVLCTSKTRPEVEFHRHRLNNRHPFVVENGGAVYIPTDYFGFDFDYDRRTAGCFVLELGVPYRELVSALAELKWKTGAATIPPEHAAMIAWIIGRSQFSKRALQKMFSQNTTAQVELLLEDLQHMGLIREIRDN